MSEEGQKGRKVRKGGKKVKEKMEGVGDARGRKWRGKDNIVQYSKE